MRLSAQSIARLRLEPGQGEKRFFDDALPGFGLRLRAGGKRTWIAQYRAADGKSKTFTIGPVEKVTADEARRRAREALATAALGNDPAEARGEARARAGLTLGAVTETYLEAAKSRVKASTYRDVSRYLRSSWEPLHRLSLNKIDRQLIAARVAEIAISNGAVSANRARTSLSALFAWCIRRGIADANPVLGSEKAVDELPRDRVLEDAELVGIWKAAEEIGYPFGTAVQLLILSGQRRSEVLEAEWREFDLERRLWTIPKERSKTGSVHLVPLAEPAIKILRGLPTGTQPE